MSFIESKKNIPLEVDETSKFEGSSSIFRHSQWPTRAFVIQVSDSVRLPSSIGTRRELRILLQQLQQVRHYQIAHFGD